MSVSKKPVVATRAPATKAVVKKRAVAKATSSVTKTAPGRGAAIARGQVEAMAVRRYLEMLDEERGATGHRTSRAVLERRLAKVEQRRATADVLTRLLLTQERIKIAGQLSQRTPDDRREELTRAFVAVGADYSRRKEISRAAWREFGVPASVLTEAGI